MMNREQRLFLTALGDFLHQRKTVLQEGDYDWAALYRCGMKHSLNGILFQQLGKQIPAPSYGIFQTDYLASIVRFRHRQEIVRQMETVLRENGIDHFYVKGDTVGALYTNPMLRSMSDVDLVVPPAQMERLGQRLIEQGFVCEHRGKSVWTFRKETLVFEVHNALIHSVHREDDAIEASLSRCWDSVRDGRLDWNTHMIYLLLHLRKHFRISGVGFRQFLDLAFVARKVPLDWGLIRAEMDRLGLWRFSMTVMNLCDEWFDADVAPEPLALDEAFVAQATETIFLNGVFGFSNEANGKNETVNAARSEGALGLLGRILSAVFPSYRELRGNRKFRFLKDRPWLLPLGWLYHIILLFAEGRVIRMFLNLLRLRETIQSRNEIYEKWGL